MTPDSGVEEQRNLEVNRTIVEGFNSGGLDSVSRYFDEDVRYIDPELPSSPLEGREAVFAHLREMLTAFDDWRVRRTDMYPVGDSIASVTVSAGAGEGTRGEMEIEMTTAHVTTFSDGKVVEWAVFGSVHDALRTVGLDPDDPGDPAPEAA